MSLPKQIFRGECGLVTDGGHDLPIETEAEIIKRYNSHDKLVELAHFLKSVIQSGESWTTTCDRDYTEALRLADAMLEARDK